MTNTSDQENKDVSRLDVIDLFLIDVPLNTLISVAYIPGGAMRAALGFLQTGYGAITFNKNLRSKGLEMMGEGAKRLIAPAITLADGFIDVGTTLVAAKRTSLLKDLKPDVSQDFVSNIIAERKQEIEEKNSNKTWFQRQKTRAAGMVKILYGASIGLYVETLKGVGHAAHGVTAMASGLFNYTSGLVTGNKELTEKGAMKIKGGARMIATGIAAPIAAPASLIIGGAYNLVTGKESTWTLESVVANNVKMVRVAANTNKLPLENGKNDKLNDNQKRKVAAIENSLKENQGIDRLTPPRMASKRTGHNL